MPCVLVLLVITAAACLLCQGACGKMGNCVLWFSVNRHSLFITEAAWSSYLALASRSWAGLSHSHPYRAACQVLQVRKFWTGISTQKEGWGCWGGWLKALGFFLLPPLLALHFSVIVSGIQTLWMSGAMCILCCLGAVELMWLYVCIKFSIIQHVIKPVSPSKRSLLREM